MDINNLRIKRHRDELNYFPVRYSTFDSHNFNCKIPACILAQHGFYHDQASKLIRCFECNFEYTDSQQDLITSLLNKHHTECKQILNSLKKFLDYDVKIETSRPSQFKRSVAEPNFYSSLVNRLASFENVKLELNKKQLSENGLYRILLKDTLSRKQSTSILSELDRVSRHVPSLIHLKCAFCPYECLVSQNGLLNTLHKSPVRDHYEKFSKICRVFETSNVNKQYVVDKNLDWLRFILSLENKGADDVEKKLNEILKLDYNDPNDVIVTKMPSAINEIIQFEENKARDLIYAPQNLSSHIGGCVTTDFNRLYTFLNSLSDNVISEKAYHPDFKMHHVRLESFRGWPSDNQMPEVLAKAGFYYFGIKDMVKCFFCNGGLKDWKASDNPYEDHVRWFPKCQFIRQLMGPEYINEINHKFKNSDSGFCLKETSHSEERITNSDNKITLLRSTPAKDISTVSQLSLVDKRLIKRAIESKLTSHNFIMQSIEKIELNKEYWVNRESNFKAIEIVKLAIELDNGIEKKSDMLRSISNFIICNLMTCTEVKDLKSLIAVKFGVIPKSVRIIREYCSFQTWCIALISLNRQDEQLVEKIVKRLAQEYNLAMKGIFL